MPVIEIPTEHIDTPTRVLVRENGALTIVQEQSIVALDRAAAIALAMSITAALVAPREDVPTRLKR